MSEGGGKRDGAGGAGAGAEGGAAVPSIFYVQIVSGARKLATNDMFR